MFKYFAKLACIWSVILATTASSLSAQVQWSSWSNTNLPEIQYRSYVLLPSGSETCHLQFRDRNQGQNVTQVDVAVDYKFQNTQTYARTVYIEPLPKESNLTIERCVSVGEVYVKNIQRR